MHAAERARWTKKAVNPVTRRKNSPERAPGEHDHPNVGGSSSPPYSSSATLIMQKA